jgi:flagellar basal-body rod modification protein FlgD
MNIQGMNPLIAAPLQAQATTSNATSGTGSSSSTTDPNSASSLQSTFLSLLATELQNQDPTQPVDPTEMVSEMISLNQLDQLVNINQTLSGLTGSSSSSAGSTSAQAGSAAAAGTGSKANSILQGASSKPSSLSAPTTAKTILGANGSLLQMAPTASPAAANQTLPVYPGAAAAGVLSPAAWMNLYGNIGAPANATNKFNTVGGR